jgi:hypothetical protein|tara:strand:- start:323 stop:643 length:321 start_codon:yes stop_codon:yes gene_type:complete
MDKEVNDLIEGKTKVMKNEHISAYAQSKIDRLDEENTKLRIALCNLRDEYLDLGGDVNQLELFDKDDPSQLKLDFEIEKTSDNDFEVIYGRRAGDSVREQFNRECD